MPELPEKPTPLEVLKHYWGHTAFRSLQEDIIQSVLDGNDTLALLPTGGGKSICFQVPALCMPGTCIVVSPLIALMKDQVQNLVKRGIPAAAVFSGQEKREIDRILENAANGAYRFLYLSPERLLTDMAKARIARMKVNLLAIDESHCISQWGYDFRPPYLEIASLREQLPAKVPVIALTATATTEVVTDIQAKLLFREGKSKVFRKSFERNNLSYSVLPVEGKLEKLEEILKRVQGTAVVYVRNRKGTKDVAGFLQQQGISADFYHAGLDHETRSKKQEDWIENRTRVIVSTNAFGMGIDKPDVRVVVHMELPDNLEAYFQEAGRAGRDEKKAYAVLLYHESDKLNLLKQYEASYPPITEIRQVYRALGSYFQLAYGSGMGQSFDFDYAAFAEKEKMQPLRVISCLKTLEQSGYIQLTETIFLPSRLQVLANKDDLYDYMLRAPKMELLLKTILRSHDGVFSHLTNIRDRKLAAHLRMSPQELHEQLSKLHRDQIIDYVPQKDKPQLIFLRAREEADYIALDTERYHFLKKRHLERMEAAIRYAEYPQCRGRQLMRYFGELDAPLCGICDVCTGRTKAAVADDLSELLTLKIKQLLRKNGPMRTEDIVKAFKASWEEKVLTLLQYMLDNGSLRETDSSQLTIDNS